MKIPCIIHDLRSYDAHLILSAVKSRHQKILVIFNNTKKYISCTIGDATFIGSMQFMMSLIQKLSKNLTEDKLKETLDQIMEVRSNLIYLFDFINVFL